MSVRRSVLPQLGLLCLLRVSIWAISRQSMNLRSVQRRVKKWYSVSRPKALPNCLLTEKKWLLPWIWRATVSMHFRQRQENRMISRYSLWRLKAIVLRWISISGVKCRLICRLRWKRWKMPMWLYLPEVFLRGWKVKRCRSAYPDLKEETVRISNCLKCKPVCFPSWRKPERRLYLSISLVQLWGWLAKQECVMPLFRLGIPDREIIILQDVCRLLSIRAPSNYPIFWIIRWRDVHTATWMRLRYIRSGMD